MTNLEYFTLSLLIVSSPVIGSGYRFLLVLFYLVAIAIEFFRI